MLVHWPEKIKYVEITITFLAPVIVKMNYHSMHFFRLYYCPRAHHVTCKPRLSVGDMNK